MKFSKHFYKKLFEENQTKKPIIKNALSAFLFGGMICLIGEGLINLYLYLGVNKDDSITFMLLTMIGIAIILSWFGIYDRVGQIAKAGTVVPITGFANSLSSSAMEYRPEGFLLGIGANTFKLAGSVIVFGILSGFFVALIKYLWWLL